MKLAVVQDSPQPPRSSKKILKAIKDLGHHAYYIPLELICVEVGESLSFQVGAHKIDLDGILLRGLGGIVNLEQFLSRYAVLKQLEFLGITIMNKVDSTIIARNKYLTLLLAQRVGISVPRTFLSESLTMVYKKAKEWKDIVIKPIIGSRGIGSLKFSDADLAFTAMKLFKRFSQPIMVQQYIEKPNRDIRVFVIDNEVVAAMYRYAPPNSWKTNIAQGGRGEPCKVTDEISEIAVKIVETLGLDYAGVDLVESKEGLRLLEVNATADFDELMKVTGVDIPTLLVKSLIQKVKK